MPSTNSLTIQTDLPKQENLQTQETPCIAELVRQQAAANPTALAVAAGSEVLSYAELSRRANRLAHYLRSIGVCRDAAVGLYLERSPAMVVAALAILRAGGAYVPLDPAQPAARLAFMLRDSNARVVVSTATRRESRPSPRASRSTSRSRRTWPTSSIRLAPPDSRREWRLFIPASRIWWPGIDERFK